MNIQTKVSEIHHQFGVTEMANYKIELLFNDLLKQEKAKWEKELKDANERIERLSFMVENGLGPKDVANDI